MFILSIETSCDETALSLVEAKGNFPNATYEVLSNELWSQIDIHREYGGVFPALAKREHAITVVPLLEKVMLEAGDFKASYTPKISPELEAKIRTLLERETGLADQLLTFHKEHGIQTIDLIAVTSGPGLEPALWVGVNFAKALALLWEVPVVAVNHMEGHVLASIYDIDYPDQLTPIEFPTIALLISGGHTELLLMKNWGQYEKIGQTRDDAVGEAYDKVARLLGIAYPGGPEIAKRAELARKNKLPEFMKLPTPMLHSGDLDFSFSGLKTAVMYGVKGKVNAEGRENTLGYKVNAEGREDDLGHKTLNEAEVSALARDFEDAVTTVLLKKTLAAIDKYNAKTLVVGGGVSANTHIKRMFDATLLTENSNVTAYFPKPGMSTDNSIMIALAGHARADRALIPTGTDVLRADGNRTLA